MYGFQTLLFQAHLEELAEKDATEKSDAVREAFLAELDLHSKKAVKGGNDNLRHTQEKSKDKRKNKDYRKAKDSKVSPVWCNFLFLHGVCKYICSQAVARSTCLLLDISFFHRLLVFPSHRWFMMRLMNQSMLLL